MKVIRNLLLLTTLNVFLVFTPCLAQLSRQDRAATVRLDQNVRQQMVADKIPGVSLAVLRDGKIILLKSYASQM